MTDQSRAEYRKLNVETSQIDAWPELLSRYLEPKPDGHFVDVGAYDGVQLSNTWPLATLGWKGLAFEPLPENAERARQNYLGLDVAVAEIAIMSQAGKCRLYPSGPGSTTQTDLIDHFNAIGGELDPANYIMVEAQTLSYALWVYGWPAEFDLLSIDVEGAEGDVLAGLDFEKHRPKMIVVEMTRELESIEQLLDGQQYQKVHQQRANWVYVG